MVTTSTTPTLPAELVEEVAKAIFRAGFHKDDTDEIVAEKWAEWDSDRRMAMVRAKAALSTPSIVAMREALEKIAGNGDATGCNPQLMCDIARAALSPREQKEDEG